MKPMESSEAFRQRIGQLKVSELMDRYPDSKPVLFNHLGASCFECPAATQESVDLALRVHHSLEDEFYQDLAQALEGGAPVSRECDLDRPSDEREDV